MELVGQTTDSSSDNKPNTQASKNNKNQNNKQQQEKKVTPPAQELIINSLDSEIQEGRVRISFGSRYGFSILYKEKGILTKCEILCTSNAVVKLIGLRPHERVLKEKFKSETIRIPAHGTHLVFDTENNEAFEPTISFSVPGLAPVIITLGIGGWKSWH